MTVLEAIQRSTEFLSRKGVESPRLQAELLLAHVLRLPRMRLYLEFERAVDEVQLDRFREMVRRRGQREPLQQIVGSTSFCGLELDVNRHVLVPRPETELLAEAGWTFLESVAEKEEAAALDWGTGSGCLAIALGVHCPKARITAADASSEAIELATRNASAHGITSGITFLLAATLQELPPGFQCDLLISNPPYIPTAEIDLLQPEVRDYEPRLALDGGPDGLDWPRRFARLARDLVRPEGKLILEFGDGQADRVRGIFSEQNWIVEEIREDYTHRPRILIARRN